MMYKSIVRIIGLALTPVYAATLLIAVIYRFIGHLWLKCTQADYAGLLGILECLFVRENSSNLSVINVFMNVKPTAINNGEEFRRNILQQLQILISRKENQRMNCVIDRRFGLSFWRVHKVNAEEQIIPFKASNSKEVKEYLSSVANFPIRNKRLVEFHVGVQLADGMYPLIFRVHHSLGDGYAIRQLLLQNQQTQSAVHNDISKSSEASNTKSFWTVFKNNIVLGIDVLNMLIRIPTLCIEQYLIPRDKNSLKSDVLSGQKILRWQTGELNKIKEIRKITKSTVASFILSAISKSLDDLFRDRGESVPNITIVFPSRKTQASNGLANEFVLVGFKLPVNDQNREMSIKERIRQLDSMPAYSYNYLLPRLAFLLYPMQLPDWVYKCSDMTAGFSNIPGPKQKVSFKKFELEEVLFFLCHLQRSNGLGVAITSYVDKFVCSVMIDRAVTQSDEDCQKIADGITNYIDDLHMRLCVVKGITCK